MLELSPHNFAVMKLNAKKCDFPETLYRFSPLIARKAHTFLDFWGPEVLLYKMPLLLVWSAVRSEEHPISIRLGDGHLKRS